MPKNNLKHLEGLYFSHKSKFQCSATRIGDLTIVQQQQETVTNLTDRNTKIAVTKAADNVYRIPLRFYSRSWLGKSDDKIRHENKNELTLRVK